MISAFKGPEESMRLEALRDAGLLDTPNEFKFDFITQILSEICNCPIALISLIDEGRQWFKSKIGLDICETNREISFCAHAILENDIFEIKDAHLDERFFDNPLVQEQPKLRFYAGIPISWADRKIGTLCVLDTVPRELTVEQKKALENLGLSVEKVIQIRKEMMRNEKMAKLLDEKMDELKYRRQQLINEVKTIRNQQGSRNAIP